MKTTKKSGAITPVTKGVAQDVASDTVYNSTVQQTLEVIQPDSGMDMYNQLKGIYG